MTGKVFGVPLAIIVLAPLISGMVLAPMVIMNRSLQEQITSLKTDVANISGTLNKKEVKEVKLEETKESTPEVKEVEPLQVLE